MQGTSLLSFNKFGQVVQVEKLFREIVDARTHGPTEGRTINDGQRAITKALLELKTSMLTLCKLNWYVNF